MTSRTSLPKSKIRILLLEGIHPNAVSTLNDAGYTSIETIAGSLKEEELIEKLRGVHMPVSYTHLTLPTPPYV